MMRIRSTLLLGLLVTTTTVSTQAPLAKAGVVSVAGCLREQAPGEWRLVHATDPKPSHANAPAPSELPALPVVGKLQFQLIGVSIFDLPRHKDHTVVLKGLLIPAKPTSRLNITSVVTVAPTCAAVR